MLNKPKTAPNAVPKKRVSPIKTLAPNPFEASGKMNEIVMAAPSRTVNVVRRSDVDDKINICRRPAYIAAEVLLVEDSARRLTEQPQ